MAETPRLVPYEMLSPGFEAIYTGRKAEPGSERQEGPMTLLTDAEGNEIRRWSVWTWTWPGQEKDWGPEIRHINAMQSALGPLDEETRRLRAHVGSLVLCHDAIPMTIDELLIAIGRGHLDAEPLHNGCWCGSMWWESRGIEGGGEAMQAVEHILRSYLDGRPQEEVASEHPHARGFIERAYEWLGPAARLSAVQRLLIERMLLPFEFFAWRNRDYAEANRNCFEGGGRGLALDAEIAKLAELPRIHPNYRPEYREALQTIAEPEKRSLYEVCGAIAHGLHGLSDCHHSSFRWIEGWVHGIGTGRLDIPSRRAGTERERLARLLFGYALALDKWLLGKPMQFLLLDLGHVDLGFDPKDGILRVYAYLGEQRTPLKECLAACLWHTLCYHRLGGNAAGLLESRHKHLAERSASLGVSVRDWIDAELAAGGKGRAET